MISKRHIAGILGKELRALADSPSATIVIVVFLLLWEFLFFQSAFLAGEASLRPLFDLLPWLLLLFIPAITMGSIAQETGDGTIEFLLTRPLNDAELILGKYLAAALYAGIAFLFALPVALCFRIFGNLDLGAFVGQFLASLGLASVFIGLGIACSSVVRNQIAALLLAAAASFLLLLAGAPLVTQSLPGLLIPFFDRLSPASHFASMARGVVDLRDVWYFASMTAIFLGIALLSLLRRRFGNRAGMRRNLRTGIGIAAAVLLILATNVIDARIPGRLDLTHGGLYTLSAGTRGILGALPVPVTITLYASSQLPVQLQPVLRDVRDTLADYRVLGKGKVIIAEKDPTNDAVSREAQDAGVRPMQFNVVGQGEFQVKAGMLGIGVSARGTTKALPFVQDTSDLEYQLTSLINTLTARDKKRIVFVAGQGEKTAGEMSVLRTQLQSLFTVEDVTLDGTASLPSNAAAVVVAGPTKEFTAGAAGALHDYLKNGGAGLFLLDGTSQDLSSMTGKANGSGALALLKPEGVAVRTDIVYDLRSHQTVQMGSANQTVLVPYAFWTAVLPATTSSPIVSRLENVTLPWGSSVSVDTSVLAKAGYTAIPLLQTTEFGGTVPASSSLDPRVPLPQSGLAAQLVAVALQGKQTNGKTSHIVVAGDSDFLADPVTRDNPTNLAFGLNALSWMTEQASLGDIQVKQRASPLLVFGSPAQQTMVQYGNLLLAAGAPILFSLYRLLRRRRLGRFTYATLKARLV